ncbi:MAG: tRNA 2-thiouridine(34) synthase MnmA [Alphaproteobacteria bacterium]|nr:tRNA 2-thiouridine(34) synthase MnmA [Alphaproteobacteria bacterium]
MSDPLGLGGRPSDHLVAVAMSGGVDSSAVAGLLVEAGYRVAGFTLQLYDHGAALAKKGACCAGQDIHDARRVADRLGIAHYVLDYEARFRDQVMAPFAASYLAGETPIPCVLCNRTVKFADLLGLSRDLGAAALVTGHYVRRVEGSAGPELHRAADAARDQSYFLFGTTKDQLARLHFPLGSRPKSETRAIAGRLGLEVASKPDSQDICFVPGGRYAEVVRKLRPEAEAPGDIVDLSGRVVGRHKGIADFTVGQRRGLGLGATTDGTEPSYVVRLEPTTRRVVAGPRSALATTRVALRELNWLGDAPIPEGGTEVEVKLRSASPPAAARLFATGSGAELHLESPQHGVAPGQAGVLYRGDRVLGGGWIAGAA